MPSAWPDVLATAERAAAPRQFIRHLSGQIGQRPGRRPLGPRAADRAGNDGQPRWSCAGGRPRVSVFSIAHLGDADTVVVTTAAREDNPEVLEGIADTARNATLRSGLVGLAGGFLLVPAFILGTLALAISIVGIPLLLVWLPGFWVAAVLAAVGGLLAVAHGAGEAFAERRFSGTEWFTRANSYYYVLTGVGLLLALYIAASVVSMAGPWLGFLEGLLRFMAVMVTVIAGCIGFGAVLISRAGRRPVRPDPLTAEVDLEADSHV